MESCGCANKDVACEVVGKVSAIRASFRYGVQACPRQTWGESQTTHSARRGCLRALVAAVYVCRCHREVSLAVLEGDAMAAEQEAVSGR